MLIRYLCGSTAALLLLSGCGEGTVPSSEAQQTAKSSADQTVPTPALWKISTKTGHLEGWLFGTIHALPDDIKWRTPTLAQAMKQSEILVVEVADLDDSRMLARVFYELAHSPNQPALFKRISPNRIDTLNRLIDESGFDADEFHSTETWAVAITLAQIASVGRTENGVDRALIQAFKPRHIIELEGARMQLGIFDSLPQKEQLDLLHAVIDEGAAGNDDEPRRLVEIWLSGNLEQLELQNGKGILDDPELRDALLIQRNQDWARQIEMFLPKIGPAMIAVGAAHMAGPDGLPALLDSAGYTITRVQ